MVVIGTNCVCQHVKRAGQQTVPLVPVSIRSRRACQLPPMRQLHPNFANPVWLLSQALNGKPMRLSYKMVNLLLAVHVRLMV